MTHGTESTCKMSLAKISADYLKYLKFVASIGAYRVLETQYKPLSFSNLCRSIFLPILVDMRTTLRRFQDTFHHSRMADRLRKTLEVEVKIRQFLEHDTNTVGL